MSNVEFVLLNIGEIAFAIAFLAWLLYEITR